MLPFFLSCVLKLIPSANASLNQSAWSRFRIFAYFKQRTFLFLRQGQYGITIAWSRCHGVPSGCYPLRSSVMIPVSAILKFTGYPSCRSVRNLCHTKWHSCNIRYLSLNISTYKKRVGSDENIIYYPHHLELNDWGKHRHNPATIIYVVRNAWCARYGCGLVE